MHVFFFPKDNIGQNFVIAPFKNYFMIQRQNYFTNRSFVVKKRMWIKGSVALCVGLCMGTAVFAANTPATLDGVKIVGAEEAKKMQDAGATIFDNRVTAEYAEKTVKGAQSLPYKEKSEKSAEFDASKDDFDLSKLPSNKATPFIFFCNGGECWRSYKAAVAAKKAGHTKIHWMRGGLPEWTSKNLPTQ